MRLLLDNCVALRLKKYFRGYEVDHVLDIGLDKYQNGQLLSAMEEHGYEVLITTDKNMRFQQSLNGRSVSVVLINTLRNRLIDLQPEVPQVLELLISMEPGKFYVVNPRDLPR